MDIDYIENELNYKLPSEFRKIVSLNLLDFDVWYIMNDKQIIDKFLGLKERYSNRQLIPFAKRDDCDDIAYFERNQGRKVFIIHDF